jgi:hypothetical protein
MGWKGSVIGAQEAAHTLSSLHANAQASGGSAQAQQGCCKTATADMLRSKPHMS